MAWQSLNTTLNTKPRVLAGPLLRKVTPTSVTVWVALRMPATVTLKVLEGSNRMQEGARHTVELGTNLHIVAVTATQQPPAAELSEGVIYSYELLFDFKDHLSPTLAEATKNAVLTYGSFTRPTFCLPPRNVNRLRLFHGSCRIPHGNGPDTLYLLDEQIAQAAANPLDRPHQLLLTGDQIYADDVSDAMSLMLGDASDALLGWTEEFICNTPWPGTRRNVMDLHPGLREPLLRNEAGFTSEDLRGQLIGVGEFLAMYLFVWSDALWPSGSVTLPSFEEIAAVFDERISPMDEEAWGGMVGLEETRRDAVTTHGRALQDFLTRLPKVRRALANIPSYMIFDDHEVTDDWNMTRDICRGMYGSELGLRVVQNALVAYALCQHWGNAPEQFTNVPGPVPPGLTLLRLLDGGDAAQYDANSPGLRTRVGVHDDAVLATRPGNALFHDLSSLTYNHTVEGLGHQIIFTDTRTWRSFPNGGGEAPVLLPQAQLQAQIVGTPPTGDRALIVVISTNAPPVLPIRTATRHSTIANTAKDFPDIYEAWELPTAATDRFFKAVSDKLPLVGGTHRGRALLLSGDVHMSFASRVLFTARARFEDDQTSPQPVAAVFAQLVASSLRKQSSDTIGFHRDGYRSSPWYAKPLIPAHQPEGYVGWNLPPGTTKSVGRTIYNAGRASATVPLEVKGPTTIAVSEENIHIDITTLPDYGYRLDYLVATNEATVPLPPPPIPPIPVGAGAAQRKQAARAYHAATGSYRVYNNSSTSKRQVVGLNNLAEITFIWGAADDKRVNHTLRWYDPKYPALVRFTTYTVSLDPDDAEYPLLKPLRP